MQDKQTVTVYVPVNVKIELPVINTDKTLIGITEDKNMCFMVTEVLYEDKQRRDNKLPSMDSDGDTVTHWLKETEAIILTPNEWKEIQDRLNANNFKIVSICEDGSVLLRYNPLIES